MNLLSVMSGAAITDANVQEAAEDYLKKNIRLSGGEIDLLKLKLSGGLLLPD